MSFVPDVVSHLAYDRESGLLYVADTGNNRIAVLDTTSGERGGPIGPNFDGCEMREVTGSAVTTLIDGADVEGMRRPSGLELFDGLLWVTDARNSVIFAFDLEGNLVDFLETEWPRDTLGGIEFDEDGDIWLVDQNEQMVLEITPN